MTRIAIPRNYSDPGLREALLGIHENLKGPALMTQSHSPLLEVRAIPIAEAPELGCFCLLYNAELERWEIGAIDKRVAASETSDGYDFTHFIPTSSIPQPNLSNLSLITELVEALESVMLGLAALVPKPSNVNIEDWPCANPADQEILHSTYKLIRAALARAKGGKG